MTTAIFVVLGAVALFGFFLYMVNSPAPGSTEPASTASYAGLAEKKKENRGFVDPLDNSQLGVDTEDVTLRLKNHKTVKMRVNGRNAKKLRSSGFRAFPRFRSNLRDGESFYFCFEDALDVILDIADLMEMFDSYEDDYYPEYEVYDETFEEDWEADVEAEVEPVTEEVVTEEVVEAAVETEPMQVEAPEVVETPVVEDVPATPVYSEPEPSYSAPEPSYSAPEPSYSPPEPSYTPDPPSYDSGSSYGGGSSYDSGGGGSSYDSGGGDY